MCKHETGSLTARGVRIGLQAGSSCCVNFEYLGRLVFLLAAVESADPKAAALEDDISRMRIGIGQKQDLFRDSIELKVKNPRNRKLGEKRAID